MEEFDTLLISMRSILKDISVIKTNINHNKVDHLLSKGDKTIKSMDIIFNSWMNNFEYVKNKYSNSEKIKENIKEYKRLKQEFKQLTQIILDLFKKPKNENEGIGLESNVKSVEKNEDSIRESISSNISDSPYVIDLKLGKDFKNDKEKLDYFSQKALNDNKNFICSIDKNTKELPLLFADRSHSFGEIIKKKYNGTYFQNVIEMIKNRYVYFLIGFIIIFIFGCYVL